MASTSLTGIFAPGSPALTEALRTLVVEPDRNAEAGDEVRVHFTFSNLGGAPATGVRVRFAHPQGVEHIPGSDLVDDRPLPEGDAFVDANGGAVGTLEPNGQRRVSTMFRVNDTIEDGSELQFQAALVTEQTALVASNIERIAVRSRPELQNSATLVTISAPAQPKPGDAVSLRATVRNTGSSSAHDVVVVMPTPEHTTYIARSARIDGRVISVTGEPFDFDASQVVSDHLAPDQSVHIEYQVTIDSPLADGTRIRANGTVGSRETSEFAIVSAEIVVKSPVDFDGEETVLTVISDDAVTPGTRVPMLLRATNTGTGIAERVQIAFELPPGLIYAPGSAHVDGQPVSDDAIPNLVFSLGALAAGRTAEAGIAATVAVPEAGRNALPIDASLRWKTGERAFSRRLAVRVASRFSRARNYVEVDRGVAQARGEVNFYVHVYNDGTAPERNVRLRLIPGLYFAQLQVAEGDGDGISYEEPLSIGVVAPHEERVFTIRARIASKVADRSTATLGVVLEHDTDAVDLGSGSVLVRSRPTIGSVAWEFSSSEPLRPNQQIDLIVRVENGGSDVLHDLRLWMTLPPELVVERAIDARRDREGLTFADVPAETTHEARVTMRLLRAVPGNRPLQLYGSLHAKGVSPVQFTPLELSTFAEARFAQSSQLLPIPSESVNAGERLYYEIRLRNDGDGPADRLTVRIVPTNLAVYVPSSTTLNGMAIADDAGASQLWSARGLVLADVNPNVELRVRWEMVVMSPLGVGTPLDTRAILEWGGATCAIAAPTVRVQAQPSLTESTAGTAISIARVFPSEEGPTYVPPPLPEPEAGIFVAPDEAPPRAIAEIVADRAESLAVPIIPAAELPTPVLYLDFGPDRLNNTVRMLERSDSAGGLVQHLFALRMLFPEDAIGAPAQVTQSFANASRALRAPLEKLFVRLRMPNLSITGKDLEDRESRDAFIGLLDMLTYAPSAAPEPASGEVVRIAGAVELDVVRALLPDLDSVPLGAVTPWLINAQMLGTTLFGHGESSDELETYRAELLNVLSLLSELPMDEFHRVLTTSVNATLDGALEYVLDALRAAARVAVE